MCFLLVCEAKRIGQVRSGRETRFGGIFTSARVVWSLACMSFLVC
jgi:hypothetical protein